MALKAHKGQLDLAGNPYILHPLRVAFKFTGDEVMYAAAVLHDVVEDSPITLRDLNEAFGPSVTEIVDSLSRRGREPYIDFIHRCNRDPLAKIIKIADIEDNLNPQMTLAPTKENLSRVKKYYQALEILRAY